MHKPTISSPASLSQAISLSQPVSSPSILSFTFVTTCRGISAQNLVRLFGMEKLAVQGTVHNLSPRLPLPPPQRSQQLLLLTHSSMTLALDRITTRGWWVLKSTGRTSHWTASALSISCGLCRRKSGLVQLILRFHTFMTSQTKEHEARGCRIPFLPALGVGNVNCCSAQRVNSPHVCPRLPPIMKSPFLICVI